MWQPRLPTLIPAPKTVAALSSNSAIRCCHRAKAAFTSWPRRDCARSSSWYRNCASRTAADDDVVEHLAQKKRHEAPLLRAEAILKPRIAAYLEERDLPTLGRYQRMIPEGGASAARRIPPSPAGPHRCCRSRARI